jgi:hypothetical protein
LLNGAGGDGGAYEISLSRNLILIKHFYDLNPGSALKVMGDDRAACGVA